VCWEEREDSGKSQDKRESHLWTLVSRKVVTLAAEVRADDRNENDMVVEDEENG
jgi:hypothetical protein